MAVPDASQPSFQYFRILMNLVAALVSSVVYGMLFQHQKKETPCEAIEIELS